MPEKKTRKAYPTYDERLVIVADDIKKIENLVAKREELVAKTAAILAERQNALESAKDRLTKLSEKQTRLLALKEKAGHKIVRPKLSSEGRLARMKEGRKKARAARKAEEEKRALLMEKLTQSGKTLDDLLAELD